MEKFIYIFLWFFVFSIPWDESVHLFGNGTLNKFIGLVFGLVSLLLILRRREISRPGVFLVLFSVYVAWGFVTYFWTVSSPLTIARLITDVQLLLMCWLFAEIGYTPRRRAFLLDAYVLGTLVSVINLIYNYSQNNGMGEYNTRFTAVGMDPNELGLTIAISIPIAWHLSIRYKKSILSWIYQSYIFCALFAILLTASRSGLIEASIGLVFILFTLKKMDKLRICIFIIVFAYLTIYSLSSVPEVIFERLGTIGQQVSTGDLNDRTTIWAAGIKAFEDNPIFGYGAGAYPIEVQKFLGYSMLAHNSYISVLVERGLIGLCVYISIILLSIWRCLQFSSTVKLLWLSVLTIFLLGTSGLTWEYNKITWFIFAMLGQWEYGRRESLRPNQVGLKHNNVHQILE